LNAAKNWHQNRGANRLDSIIGVYMRCHYCKVPSRRAHALRKKSGGLLAARVANQPKARQDLTFSS